MPIRISLLGPIEAAREGRTVELGSRQQQAVLALLALRAGRLTPVETIVDALWPGHPPESAGKVVQTYISRLRKALGADAIVYRNAGYVLDVPREAVDATRAEDFTAAGRPAEALALWRGPALAGLRTLPAMRTEADRLEELRQRAIEERLAVDLAAGRHDDVIAEARRLLADDPLRERALEQLMLALYAAGRQAEALEVYRSARRAFVEQLGLEPGPALKELERRILAQDPSLASDLPVRRSDARRRRRTPLAAALAGVVVAAAATAALVVAGREDQEGERRLLVRPDSIVRIDPRTNRIVDSIPVGRDPAGILATEDAVWVANERDRTLSRVDMRTRNVRTIGGVTDVAFLTRDERGNIYASGWDSPFVWRIDPRKLEVVERYRVQSRALALAIGGGSLWVVDRLVNSVMRIDLRRGSVRGILPVGADPLVATFGYGTFWVANSDDGSVSAIRAGVSSVETIEGIDRPFGIAAGEGGVWVGSNTRSTVSRIDPDTRQVVAEINVAKNRYSFSGLFDVAVGQGAVWAANRSDHNVVRIDPRTNSVTARIGLGVVPHDIDVAANGVWISVARLGSE